MRAVGIDLGETRIGVAVSDSAGQLATPYEVLTRSGSREQDHRHIAAIVAEVEAEILIIGLPLSLDGSLGKAAQGASDEADLIASLLSIPVEMHDERFTTVEAERKLKEQNLDAPARRKIVDKVAAAILLQAWLDGQ
ncbi:MAG: Holliday junction resolvase RuvX [Acidimicrobiaceae bacterium]|nr:Holliday junction resolvase RuvX [Acidimicrobiaceae bacterium]MEE2806178.1 Holliday junction resolvase RuvX [Actinomycetota bacterium]|tara:strand:- start:1720 stop:2130 length:411 start_codon:yes stop_codon:yes gene_type:complete